MFDNPNDSGKKKMDKAEIMLKNEKLKSQYEELEGQRVSILTER